MKRFVNILRRLLRRSLLPKEFRDEEAWRMYQEMVEEGKQHPHYVDTYVLYPEKLSQEERETIAEHIATCARCQEIVADTERHKDHFLNLPPPCD